MVEGQPTGVCVALVLGACRCLCADIGAAATCLPQHVFTPDLLPVMEAAEFIYVEGYFITHSFPAALQVCGRESRSMGRRGGYKSVLGVLLILLLYFCLIDVFQFSFVSCCCLYC